MATKQNSTRTRPMSHDRADSGSRLVPSDAFSWLLEMDDGINPQKKNQKPSITQPAQRRVTARLILFQWRGKNLVHLAFPWAMVPLRGKEWQKQFVLVIHKPIFELLRIAPAELLGGYRG